MPDAAGGGTPARGDARSAQRGTRDEFDGGGSGRLRRSVVRIACMEGSRPPEFEVEISGAISAPGSIRRLVRRSTVTGEAPSSAQGLKGDRAVVLAKMLGMFANRRNRAHDVVASSARYGVADASCPPLSPPPRADSDRPPREDGAAATRPRGRVRGFWRPGRRSAIASLGGVRQRASRGHVRDRARATPGVDSGAATPSHVPLRPNWAKPPASWSGSVARDGEGRRSLSRRGATSGAG